MGQGISGHVKLDGGLYFINENSGHTVPLEDKPNSVTQTYDDESNLVKERYYDGEGKAYIDVDYTDHGNPKLHPKVPHRHYWDWSDLNNPVRRKTDD